MSEATIICCAVYVVTLMILDLFCLYIGTTEDLIVSTSRLPDMSTTLPVYLDLVDSEGITIHESLLTLCGSIFIGSATFPSATVHYRLRGYDRDGNVFEYTRADINQFPSPDILDFEFVNNSVVNIKPGETTAATFGFHYLVSEGPPNTFTFSLARGITGFHISLMPLSQSVLADSSFEITVLITASSDVHHGFIDEFAVSVQESCSENTQIFFITVKGCEVIDHVPTSLLVSSLQATSATFSWESPVGDYEIFYYHLIVSENVFGLLDVHSTYNSSSTMFTAEGLDAYSAYECAIAAVNGCGSGPLSTSINFTTLEAGKYKSCTITRCRLIYACYELLYTAPASSPQNITGSAEGPTLVSLRWLAPRDSDINGLIRYYTVHITEVVTDQQWSFFAVKTHINIGPLHPYYDYKCQVAAHTVDTGPFSDPIIVTSGETGRKNHIAAVFQCIMRISLYISSYSSTVEFHTGSHSPKFSDTQMGASTSSV